MSVLQRPVPANARAVRLHAQLESGLPQRIRVGGGTALFVAGWCYCAELAVRRLELLVDGEAQPLMAYGMPRLTVLEAAHPGSDPYALVPEDLRSYRSGFWGMARIAARDRRTVTLELRAELEDGAVLTHPLAELQIARAEQLLPVDWPDPASGPRVAICMATYNPPLELLRRQIESIRAQSHRNWVCVISDDCSDRRAFGQLSELVAGDARFVISRSPERLGFFRNFERALELAPTDAAFIALADQDDLWHEDKLAALLAEIGPAELAFSDARVVAPGGEVISETWWDRRRNNHSDLLSVLVANSITGAAALFRRDLLEDALPFPPAQFAHFHDHWLGLVALACGRVTYVDRPLYDYVQHSGASLGHEGANVMPAPLRARLQRVRLTRERVRMWRLHYFVDACRLQQLAAILELRVGDRMPRRKRRALRSFQAAERSLPALIRLGWRGALELLGRHETLGAEWMLFWAFLWRRLLGVSARERPTRGLRLDALPPPSLFLPPGRRTPPGPAQTLAEKIAPLPWMVSEQAPPRINLLIPTIDLRHLFGGYIAKFNLARRLAERGLAVRIVTVDPVGPLSAGWRAEVESYGGLSGLFDRVEVAFGRESGGIEISRRDEFIATTWWTAHIAGEALEHVDARRFVYLIQEYEPFTFPMGSLAALAAESYRRPHFALFSSELLREYFRRHGLGVFAAGEASGQADSLSFENAITQVAPPSAGELAARTARALLFYARPEPHAARNMYELGLLALSAAVAEGTFGSGWTLHGIGTVSQASEVALGGGATLSLLPRSEQSAYAEVLRRHDLGLALMYTPHPSLVPIEMAAAGLITVTNSFENKTPEAMAGISGNLITAEPSVEGILAGLRAAAERVEDHEARVARSAVNWSRDWDDSFGDELLDRLIAVLREG